MLVFIDESGDPGLNIKPGASKLFVLVALIYPTEADACNSDKLIDSLRIRLGWYDNNEFHFKRDSRKVKDRFLQMITSCKFSYFAVVVDKLSLYKSNFQGGWDLYNDVFDILFREIAKELCAATLIVDQCGNSAFQKSRQSSLKRRADAIKYGAVHKVKMQSSSSNNLLQVADYIAGSLNYAFSKSIRDRQHYRNIVVSHEVKVSFYPKMK